MECFYKFYSFKYILLKYFCISMFSLFFSTFFFLDECLSNTVENIPVTQKKPDGVTKLIIDKSICDFGNIKPNSTHTAVFNLTNAGKKTLVIEDVRNK